MILPQTFGAALFLVILGMLCLGAWAAVYKTSSSFRYELSYFDFALGAVVLAIIYALTWGNLGFDGFSFMDDLSHAGKREWFFAFLAGVVFNVGNMLLVSSVSVSAITVAFPTAFSMALIVATAVRMITGPAGSTGMVLGGMGFLLAAIVLAAMALSNLRVVQHEEEARAGKAKSTRRPSSVKGIVLGVLGGVFLGFYLPLVDKAREIELGVGPFTLAVLFTMGLIASTLVLAIFFINLPVEGEPAEIKNYLQAGVANHFKAFLAGGIFLTGALALWVVESTPDLVKDSRALVFLLTHASPILAALLGIFAWREFAKTDIRAKALLLLMIVLFAGGVAMIALAPSQLPAAT